MIVFDQVYKKEIGYYVCKYEGITDSIRKNI